MDDGSHGTLEVAGRWAAVGPLGGNQPVHRRGSRRGL